jgi:hypothetical protein
MGGRQNNFFFFSDKFGWVDEIKFFNQTNFTDQLHRKFSIFTHNNFTELTLPTAIRCRKKILAEKVSELTDFIDFGVEEKNFTDTDRRPALPTR